MIRKILLYFVILTGALYLLREIHYQGLLKQNEGYYGKLKTAFLRQNNFSVLFLGSSRAEMAYDTQLYDSLTGRRSFNLGLAGAGPRVAYAALQTYLSKSSPPETLFYEVDLHALRRKNAEIREFNNYFPFLKDTDFRRYFSAIDPRMKHFYINPYYSWPYTGHKNISTGLHGWLNIPNRTDALYHNGFLGERFRPPPGNYLPEKFELFIHPHERAFLDSIITLSATQGIALILITSPVHQQAYSQARGGSRLTNQLRHIAVRNGIIYMDLSEPEMSKDRGYFTDPYHLNWRGARCFTREFVRAIEQ